MRIINPICIQGSIKPDESFEKFIADLSAMQKRTRSRDTITFCINSGGGDTHTGLGIYDLIVNCERNSVGLVSGRAESIASLILQACRKRVITKNSFFLFHQTTVTVSGTVTDATAGVQKFATMDEKMYKIFSDRSRLSLEEVRSMAKDDRFMEAEDALEFGLVDKII